MAENNDSNVTLITLMVGGAIAFAGWMFSVHASTQRTQVDLADRARDMAIDQRDRALGQLTLHKSALEISERNVAEAVQAREKAEETVRQQSKEMDELRHSKEALQEENESLRQELRNERAARQDLESKYQLVYSQLEFESQSRQDLERRLTTHSDEYADAIDKEQAGRYDVNPTAPTFLDAIWLNMVRGVEIDECMGYLRTKREEQCMEDVRRRLSRRRESFDWCVLNASSMPQYFAGSHSQMHSDDIVLRRGTVVFCDKHLPE